MKYPQLIPPTIPPLTADLTNIQIDFIARITASLLIDPIPFRDFIDGAWPLIVPARALQDTWHIGCTTEYLEAVELGQIKRLIFNFPPRALKSILCSVLWPAWSWTKSPWLKWIFASYAMGLSTKHSQDRRRIIDSPWYQQNWGDMVKFEEDQNQKAKYENTQRGSMMATSVGGGVTGEGCDREVIDDLINPEMAESEAERSSAIDFYQLTLATRLDDKINGAIVIVEQRTHTRDLTAVALKEGGWTHVVLPLVAERKTIIVFPLSQREVVREEGDILNPTRDTPESIADLKGRMGTRGFNAQAQQNPVNKQGGYFKDEWWQYYRPGAMPAALQTVWAWDTAAKKEQSNDFTAGFLISRCATGYYVQKIVNKKLEYPEMKRRLEQEWAEKPGDAMPVEDSSNGQAVIQDLRRTTNLPIIAFQATTDKITRANIISPICEALKVYLPEGLENVSAFIDQAAAFPAVDHDDMVDAFVVGMMTLSGKSKVGVPNMYAESAEEND